jgi:serine/threonine-protein kinase
MCAMQEVIHVLDAPRDDTLRKGFMTSPAETELVKEGDLLVGKYRVERVLGVGGMGVVVAATHIDLDQRVALKFLLPDLTQNAEAVERFLREARSAVKLRSDHVAKVLDVGKLETGAPYIVMEYLEGNDLGTVIEQKRPAQDVAIDYMLQTCEAIAEAHHLGIVHRDLKPQNLFVTKRVHGAALIKVLDFGISKAVTPAGVRDMTLTKTGIVMGSPLYMSPEQMKSGRLADHRSDLWALGVILYEMLTGTQPFQAETVPHLCAMIMTEQPRPPREIEPKLPIGLNNVVMRCLEKDPTKRYQNVAELAAALEPYAPASARGATGRISNVLNVSGMIEVSTAPTEPKESIAGAMSAGAPAQSSTSVGWSENKNATTMRRVPMSRGLWIGIAGALTVVAVIVIAVTRGGSHETSTPSSTIPVQAATDTAKAKPTDDTPPAATPTPATTPTPTVVATDTPPPSSSTTPTKATTPTTTTSKIKPSTTTTKPTTNTNTTKPTTTASTKPTATATGKPPGDLFGDPQ